VTFLVAGIVDFVDGGRHNLQMEIGLTGPRRSGGD